MKSKYTLKCFVFLITVFTASNSFASEVCEWTANKSMELHDLKVESNFPEKALTRFAEAFVDAERDEGFFKKSFHKGVMIAFVETLFDPEMFFLTDGTLSQSEIREIFFESCMEMMN